MRAILPLMIKVLVVPFYRNHAGLLFFVLFIMFGIVESTQIVLYHTSLIYGMLSSGIFLIVVFFIWLLYQLKSLHFLLKTSGTDAYSFLNLLALLPAVQSFLYFLLISFITFLPVFIYTLAIYVIGIQQAFYNVLALIFVFQLALWLMNAWVLNHSIRQRHVASRVTVPAIALPYQQTQVGICGGYLFKEEKSALMLSKVFSLVLIYIVKETLEPGDDFRIVGITWLFAMLANTYLVQKLKTFEDHSMSWTRNLPIPVTKTFFSYLLLYSLVMIPELLLLTGNIGQGLSLLQFILLPIFSSVFLMAIHAYLLKSNRDPDQFLTFLFWLFLGCFMLVLSKMIWATAVALLLISSQLFHKRFFKYEPVE